MITENKKYGRHYPGIDLEFEENSLYQEGIISETYQRPDKSHFQEPKELENLINMGRLVQNSYQSRLT